MAVQTPLLRLDHVGCRMGRLRILEDVSFALQRGQVWGLLGVNGAGKSTTLSIIAGLRRPDAGRVWIDGRDMYDDGRRSRHRTGWVPEYVPLWPELTVVEALDAGGRLRGLAGGARRTAIERELARLDLGAVAHRLCSRLSLGQRRRMGLAQALLHEPDLLVLDEPGNGLDPVQAARLQTLIGTLAAERGVILSSHDLAEVEATCDHVVILHDGRVRHAAPISNRPGDLAACFQAVARPPAHAAA